MNRPGYRIAMAVVGVGVFLVYALAALGGYLILEWLVSAPTDLGLTLAVVVGLTLVGGYVSYEVGTRRLLESIGATDLPRRRAASLYRRYDRLAAAIGVSPPRLLVGDLGAPNAMSIGGPRSGVIVVDRSLFDLLTLDELEGILAHELAHVESHDTFVQTMAVNVMQSLTGLLFVLFLPVTLLTVGYARALAWFAGRPERAAEVSRTMTLLVQIVVGLLLSVVTLAILAYGRRREFAADARAAAVTGRPAALARALAKIHRAANPDWGIRSLLTIHGDERSGLRRWFSTHPPVAERIERLVTAERRWQIWERHDPR